jgi:hypothetical protein
MMDAQLVWNTWRRILKDDQFVDWVLHPTDSHSPQITGLSDGEIAILADYASTPVATDSNIGMYRRGLVRNALAALSLVPLTRGLLYESGLDVECVASDFVQSAGYRDDGPYFWRIADTFIAYLVKLPEFSAQLQQDVLRLDAAAVALARRLGQSAPEVWPLIAARTFSEAGSRAGRESARFVGSGAAVAVSTSHDLTGWIENPQDFDPDEALEPSTRHWLIYFPAADAPREYAELSDRTASVFNLLSTPKSPNEMSLALDGFNAVEVLGVIRSLAELGVVVREEDG